ncbi:MAG: hypothetical protein KAQ94_10215 [Arcobacteraceae bacterium]|nr:hypothetical protein [Arcobacteraceae bacterium]
MGFGSILQKIFSSVKLKKRVFDPEKIELVDLILPDFIDTFDSETVYSMVREELNTFQSLEYKNKPIESLNIKEYHSFQIGIILKFLLLEYDLFITNKKDIFPSFILNTPKEKVKHKVFYIINLYGNTVAKTLSGKDLVDDVRWSPIDIAYLLYYLCTYKEHNEIN